tara:strand:+ start:273 stop:488 length:216 start_codon:yes stop_codon:yes gene_type:complete
MSKKKLILRNDPAKKRRAKNQQQINISISKDLHLSIKELKTREERKRGVKIKLEDFYQEVIVKGEREWLNQ